MANTVVGGATTGVGGGSATGGAGGNSTTGMGGSGQIGCMPLPYNAVQPAQPFINPSSFDFLVDDLVLY